jgi:glutamyl-tRNA synthetase
MQYLKDGYLPEALLNYLVRLGWSHGDQEVFTRDEIARLFDLDHVGRAAARADADKLLHLNQHWIKTLPRKELLERLAPFLEEVAGHPVPVTPELERLVDLLRERSRSLGEMAARARFAVADSIALDEKAAAKHLKPAARPALADLRARLAGLEVWDDAALEAAFTAVCESHALKIGKLAQPVRVAVTGEAASPGIYETLAVLGRERTLARLDDACARLEADAG